MKKDNALDIVKIYFIDPIDIISVVISTLIDIEFESYTVNLNDRDNLLKILPDNVRNVLFICIKNHREVNFWLEFIKKAKTMDNKFIQLGAFIYDRMSFDLRDKFLEENVAMIEFNEIKQNTLQTMRRILLFFEAKNKRGYISTKAMGISEAYFKFADFKEPIVGKILSISAFAFSCQIDKTFKTIFTVNSIFKESLLVLNGTRINTGVKVVGFHREQNEIYMFKYVSTQIENNKMVDKDAISAEMKRKVHNYIKWCLRENIKHKMNKLTESEKTKK